MSDAARAEAERRWPLTGDDLDVLDTPAINAFVAGATWQAAHPVTMSRARVVDILLEGGWVDIPDLTPRVEGEAEVLRFLAALGIEVEP